MGAHRCGTACAQCPAGAWGRWSTDTVEPVPRACICQTVQTAFEGHECSLHSLSRRCSLTGLPHGTLSSVWLLWAVVCVTLPPFYDRVPASNSADPGHPRGGPLCRQRGRLEAVFLFLGTAKCQKFTFLRESLAGLLLSVRRSYGRSFYLGTA